MTLLYIYIYIYIYKFQKKIHIQMPEKWIPYTKSKGAGQTGANRGRAWWLTWNGTANPFIGRWRGYGFFTAVTCSGCIFFTIILHFHFMFQKWYWKIIKLKTFIIIFLREIRLLIAVIGKITSKCSHFNIVRTFYSMH